MISLFPAGIAFGWKSQGVSGANLDLLLGFIIIFIGDVLEGEPHRQKKTSHLHFALKQINWKRSITCCCMIHIYIYILYTCVSMFTTC